MSKLKVSIRSIVMFLFALMFVVAGLSLLSRYTSEQFIYRSKKPLKIGATYMTVNNPFFNVIDDEVRNVVEANGDVLISLDPALDLQKQKEQIHYLIEQGVSALII
ncbi:MAG TPA: GntR family transcriptional regulator, partial [Erysipelotrichaceae bacterium]|nr:GntR family transcriptional regulator [Erysipelotrichaceae bacterium]